jgi:hypothetical protein
MQSRSLQKHVTPFPPKSREISQKIPLNIKFREDILIDLLFGRSIAYRMLKKYTKSAEDLGYIIELNRDYAPAHLQYFLV